MMSLVINFFVFFFFFNDTATTEIYTLSLHDALPILRSSMRAHPRSIAVVIAGLAAGCAAAPQTPVPLAGTVGDLAALRDRKSTRLNSSHSQISYAVFCLKKKRKQQV